MNLQPVTMREGQAIQCSACLKMRPAVKADLDAKTGTFYCSACEPVCPNCGQWQHAYSGDCVNDCAQRGFAPFRKAVAS